MPVRALIDFNLQCGGGGMGAIAVLMPVRALIDFNFTSLQC